MRRAWIILSFYVATAATAAAQTVTGSLVAAGGEPLPGALVTLLREGGEPERATVSRTGGLFTFETGEAGRFLVRVERPGFLPFTSAPFEVTPGSDARLRVVATSGPRVPGSPRAGGSSCVAGAVYGAAAGLWEQAALSLNVMALAEEARLLDVQGVRYVRLLNSSGELQEGVLEQEPFAGASPPYPAPRTTRLPATGFVSLDGDGGYAYHLPLPAILLSESFQASHCFHRIVTERGRPEQVGLGFRPAGGGRGVGIEGVLWLDRRSGAVRELTFEYRDPEKLLPRAARGSVGFSIGKDGLPQLSRWWVRVPRTFETRFVGAPPEISGRNATTIESGAFVFGPGDRPLEDPDGVFALLGGMFSIGPILVEAERAQRIMTEGAQKQIRLNEIRGASPTDAWDIVRTLRPNWLARAASPALAEGAAEGELVVYLDHMRLSTLNGDPDAGGYAGAERALAMIPAAWIASIEYIPPIEAAAIYGMGHGYGVVVIRSRRQ